MDEAKHDVVSLAVGGNLKDVEVYLWLYKPARLRRHRRSGDLPQEIHRGTLS
jgi:hypothetical protein